MMTTDIVIRNALLHRLEDSAKNDPMTRIVSEVEVCMGYARVDVLMVNGTLHGFEIKSDKDTLDRLAHQSGLYEQVFEKITIVCGESHYPEVMEEISPWWGITIARASKKGIILTQKRKAKKNPIIDPYSVVQLLWREEALLELQKRGLDKGVRSKPRNKIWERLAESIPLNELCTTVRQCIKNRQDWRIAEQQV